MERIRVKDSGWIADSYYIYVGRNGELVRLREDVAIVVVYIPVPLTK